MTATKNLTHVAQTLDQKIGDRIVRARAKAFSGQGIQSHRFAVSQDGTVRVWDDVAGHYTTCHCLSESAQKRIRKLAAK